MKADIKFLYIIMLSKKISFRKIEPQGDGIHIKYTYALEGSRYVVILGMSPSIHEVYGSFEVCYDMGQMTCTEQMRTENLYSG